MSSLTTLPEVNAAVAQEVRNGLFGAAGAAKTLSPWLFYDERGSQLFEAITALPEYYLTRTERGLFAAHAEEILELASPTQPVAIVELGAGTASKTGLLLRAAVACQATVLYQPVDVSESALEEARRVIQAEIPGVLVRPQVANYMTEALDLTRPKGTRTLALYIGSSIGNFSVEEAGAVLRSLREQLHPGGSLLLGTDLAPGEHKSIATLLAAYDDAAGTTAAFNLNVLTRLNRELGADFDLEGFGHKVVWNAERSRIEMHLESLRAQRVRIPGNSAGPAATLEFARGETIHTENSHKFTPEGVKGLLMQAGFRVTRSFEDQDHLFAVTLAMTP